MNNENHPTILKELKETIVKEGKTAKEVDYLFNNLKNAHNKEERNMIFSQIIKLGDSLEKINDDIPEILDRISLTRPLYQKEIPEKIIIPEVSKEIKKPVERAKIPKEFKITGLEKLTIERLKKKKKEIVKEKTKKPSKYINVSNRIFSDFSRTLLKKDTFLLIEKDLMKSNLEFAPVSYISMVLFTTLISGAVSVIIFLFLLFFSLKNFPLISFVEEPIMMRFLKVFWVLFIIPLGTFIFMYFYPTIEKNSSENKINQELPFATIHMATISGSMIEPSRIFSIIISTKEYPYLEKEFRKLLNFINVYGYDLVTALRSVAINTPSKKLADLFNSLVTTINSGGDLPDFFNKRAQSLLFEYKLEREKYIKFSETFMDIYISAVIAAPMILMLLLMMMKLSGLGIALSSAMISLIMVIGVSVINVIFLTFLHLRQPTG